MWPLKKFVSNEDGNISMMFSLGAVMLVTGMAVAIDYSNMIRLKASLQSQVDASVLAAATADLTLDGNNGENENQELRIRRAAAFSVIEANGFDRSDMDPEFTMIDGTVTVKAEMSYTPFFGRFLGKEEVKISAFAESGLGEMQAVEIALVLDNTDSMLGDGKMTALKAGAVNLVKAIEESGSGSEIALVPFSRYVRLDESLWDAPWLEKPEEFDTTVTWQQATHTGGTCHREMRTRTRDGFEEEYETEVCENQTTTYEEMSEVRESRFDGCIGTRLPPFSELDDSYSTKIPGLLKFIPRQHFGTNRNLTSFCPRAIQGLSTDYDALEFEINELYATDVTYLPSGLIWGQRVLSPGVPFDNVVSEMPKRKIMVLMTDGKNTSKISTSQAAQDYYFAPPYLEYVTENDGYSPEANQVTARLCETIKAENIEIITIAFQVNDIETKNLLQNCASEPSKAYTAENNQALIDTFESISESLDQSIRLIR